MILNPVSWIKTIQDEFTVVPDLTFLLDLEPEIAIARLDVRDNKTKFEKIEFLKKVRANYLAIAKREPRRFIVLDATDTQEDLEKQALREIRKLLGRMAGV